jgi:2-polyprenyl-3-methyl-5-hydroxy-6-metoxy-1,4-benzoquinol methylase
MSRENEILQSWHGNAHQWIRTVEGRLIASRAYTDKAVLQSILRQQPSRVLDAGCGEGWLVRSLAQAGIEACGFDASPVLIEAANAQGLGRFVTATYADVVANPATLGRPYDIVVFNFSLLDEQVSRLLRAAGTLLLPGGRIVIQTLHPMIASAGEYVSGWRVETFASLADGDWQPMPWFFRTLEAWVDVFSEAGLTIGRLSEPRNFETNQVLSVLFELAIS